MKLATLRTQHPDGELVLVSRDLSRMVRAADIAPTLQHALDDWDALRPALEERARAAEQPGAEAFAQRQAHSPLPRAYQWVDGSTYQAHNDRMSQWIGRPLDPRFGKEPFMYQGASDHFIPPTGDIAGFSEEWGIDYEGEIAIVTGPVPLGTTAAQAGSLIRLVLLCNDISLRNLIPPELSKNFGFVQSKATSSFAPVAVTPDELGTAWRDCRLHGRLVSIVNGDCFGDPEAGLMLHGFDELIAHVAKTRSLAAGSIIGGGTVADPDPARGTSCITERRVVELLRDGVAKTPYLRRGDRVRLEMLDEAGQSFFGAIDQQVI